MKTLTFNKEENNWFIDLPEWEGSKAELAMVAGADKMLDKIGGGKSPVTLLVSEEKIEGYDKITWMMNTPIVGGAMYKTKFWPIWLCDVVKFVFDGKMPKILYYKLKEDEKP